MMALLMGGIAFEGNYMSETSRVINYTGLLRGNSQRLVKRELAGNPSDPLIDYMEQLLVQLNGSDGTDRLVRLNDKTYQNNLAQLQIEWKILKEDIFTYRQTKDADVLLRNSETFFEKADKTVAAAEANAALQAEYIWRMEMALALLILILFIEVIYRTAKEFGLIQRNKTLNQIAYVDLNTRLPNKTACFEIIEEHSSPEAFQNHGCIVFDLNNLKQINDTYGHEYGNIIISSFARIIQACLPLKAFVGRWGGDEFIAVFETTDHDNLQIYIEKIQKSIADYNKKHSDISISFAYGTSLSEDNPLLNLKEHLVIADHNMYEYKRKMKLEQKA
jgi:diguanylate cyclase (GGDEF)-like protein